MAELNTKPVREESVLFAVLLLAAKIVRNAPKPGDCQEAAHTHLWVTYSSEYAAAQPAAKQDIQKLFDFGWWC